MGLKISHTITCDGPGCDLNWTGELDSAPSFFAEPVTIEMKKQILWNGYLCPPCEAKVYNALVGAIPRT